MSTFFINIQSKKKHSGMGIVIASVYRGYYTVAQRYEFYFRVAKQYLRKSPTSE